MASRSKRAALQLTELDRQLLMKVLTDVDLEKYEQAEIRRLLNLIRDVGLLAV